MKSYEQVYCQLISCIMTVNENILIKFYVPIIILFVLKNKKKTALFSTFKGEPQYFCESILISSF